MKSQQYKLRTLQHQIDVIQKETLDNLDSIKKLQKQLDEIKREELFKNREGSYGKYINVGD